MNHNYLSLAVERVVELKLQAVDRFVEETVETLTDFGNPEKLIGKPYEQWTPYDRALLEQVYAGSDYFKRFVFNKDYEHIKELESEEV